MTTLHNIIGYVVKNNCGEYLAANFANSRGGNNGVQLLTVVTKTRPSPVSRGDAYRRLAAYFDEVELPPQESSWAPWVIYPTPKDFYVAPIFTE